MDTNSVPTQNYVWQQGSDEEISLVYNEGPAGAEVPVSLVGWSLRMDVVDAVTQERMFTFNTDDIAEPGVDVVGPSDNEATLGADGSINILIPRLVTLPGSSIATRLDEGHSVFCYDIFLRDTQNRQHPILRGSITVQRSHTLWA